MNMAVPRHALTPVNARLCPHPIPEGRPPPPLCSHLFDGCNCPRKEPGLDPGGSSSEKKKKNTGRCPRGGLEPALTYDREVVGAMACHGGEYGLHFKKKVVCSYRTFLSVRSQKKKCFKKSFSPPCTISAGSKLINRQIIHPKFNQCLRKQPWGNFMFKMGSSGSFITLENCHCPI